MDRPRGVGRGTLVSLLIISSVTAVVLWQHQAIYDWARLRNYVPPPEIAALAASTTMNGTAKHLFYVNQPELQDKEQFNQSCTDSEQSIVLGCYIQNRGIYLYNVTDKRLDGVEEVTAAHETLHAAYDRLSAADRKRIDQLTEQAYKNIQSERIKKTVESYRTKDPSVVPNELHSIIGTEVRNLPPELENYYKRYFDNRLAIVSMSESYEKEFESRDALAKDYRQQLESLRNRVNDLNRDLATRANELSVTYKNLQNSRGTTDAATFNTDAKIYNNKVAAYNADVGNVSLLIDKHNALLEKYNAVVLEENELIKAIDSRPSTINAE